MRLAAPMPRMSACVRIELSQKPLKSIGARTATTRAATPIDALGRELRPVDRHAALPKRPCGRNASTSAISANVSTTEYCVQHSFPVVGR